MKGFFDYASTRSSTRRDPTRILEVGLGEGIVSERLRDRFPDASIVGIDLADGELGDHWRSRGLSCGVRRRRTAAVPRRRRSTSSSRSRCSSTSPTRIGRSSSSTASASDAPRRVGAVRADLADRQHGARSLPEGSRQHARPRQPLEPQRVLPVRRRALERRRRRQSAAVDDGPRHARSEHRLAHRVGSLANIVGLAIGIAGLAFVGVRIARDWDQITETLRSAQPAWLVAAVVAGLVSMAIIGVNWLALIRRRGHAHLAVRGLSWFFTGQLGKYVPGGIWPVVGQAELAGRGGADRRSAYLATASSMTFTLARGGRRWPPSAVSCPRTTVGSPALLIAARASPSWSASLAIPAAARRPRTSRRRRSLGDAPNSRTASVVAALHAPPRAGVGDVRDHERVRVRRARRRIVGPGLVVDCCSPRRCRGSSDSS